MTKGGNPQARIVEMADTLRDDFTAVSDEIWGHAELRFVERKSCQAQIAVMEKHGFKITRNAAGIETAFVAERGSEGPVIAFLGEFDALSGLSQKAGLDHHDPIVTGGTGHGCGHNLLGSGAMLAAATLARVAEEQGIPVRVRYYGCPGEEGGSGKAFMAREGLFDDVDAALTWHPAPITGARSNTNLAVMSVYYRFEGRAAHASHSAHLGRSALDAMELMNVGVNFLREHVPPDVRMHYAITDTGGSSPNVVQARAESLYYVRAQDVTTALEVIERVNDVARGAALMTGTEAIISVDRGTSNLVPNTVLEQVIHDKLVALGPVPFDAEDHAFARRIQATFPEGAVEASTKLYHAQKDAVLNRIDPDAALHTGIRQFEGAPHHRAGSTDVGDVSWLAPTVQCWTATWALGTPLHTWQVVAQGKSPGAHKAMIHAGKALAATGLEMLTDPEVLRRARAEWQERLNGKRYVSPIPDGVEPQPPREVV
ncbi:amidohydrolase [Ponticoccus alexandrii]|uniref:Amidohydrolase n=1 Tax=Ponticoccus alexandrii TaxID=1943633 RepID=A0ABX7FEG4_9RHOB|nr:amidohydrolase [Ponticoccus alexandrii]QRF68930.1 amidohydrolase [Ponticoccus alexandrii]